MVRFILKTLLFGNKVIRQAIQNPQCQRPLVISAVKLDSYADDKVETEQETHSTNYVNTEEDYGFGKRYVVRKLQQLFKLSNADAQEIAVQNKQLWLVNGKQMADNYKLCQKENVSDEILLKHPMILAQKNLRQKIDILKKLSSSPISETIPLTTLNSRTVSLLEKQNRHAFINRTQTLANLFQVSEADIFELYVKKRFLLSISLKKIETNYNLLLEYGISREAILNDLWALRYSTDIIRERLEKAKLYNLEKLKTWMIRAKQDIFDTHIKRTTENKEILGENSVVEYLADRLSCTQEQVQVIIKRHPALQNKSMPKLKAALDYLYSAGFQPFQIVRAPKILLHSMETTKKRLEELEQKGIKPNSLYILTKSQKQFLRFYDSFNNMGKMKSNNVQ